LWRKDRNISLKNIGLPARFYGLFLFGSQGFGQQMGFDPEVIDAFT
jgi:hypothetical protein